LAASIGSLFLMLVGSVQVKCYNDTGMHGQDFSNGTFWGFGFGD